ncbi:electron transfer flavoprotein subunit alpha, partial [Sulfolobus sp. F1]
LVNRKKIVIEENDIEKAVDKLLEYLKSDGVL